MGNLTKTEDLQRGRKKRIGIVISDCQDKTVIVKVTRNVSHPKYKKIYKKSKKYYVHDEENELKIGDKVSIIETRPLSKLKRWKLFSIL